MAIAYDNSSSVVDVTDISAPVEISWSHTCSGEKRLLVVGIFVNDLLTPTSVTYGGVSMTLIRTQSSSARLTLWYLVGPKSGSNTVLATMPSNISAAGGIAVSLSGVDPRNPLDNNNGTTTGAASSVSTDITPVSDNCWVVDACLQEASGASLVVEAGQTQRQNQTHSSGLDSAMSTEGPVTPVGVATLGWNDGGSAANPVFLHAVASFKPYLGNLPQNSLRPAIFTGGIAR